jgi:hypothetical protein
MAAHYEQDCFGPSLWASQSRESAVPRFRIAAMTNGCGGPANTTLGATCRLTTPEANASSLNTSIAWAIGGGAVGMEVGAHQRLGLLRPALEPGRRARERPVRPPEHRVTAQEGVGQAAGDPSSLRHWELSAAGGWTKDEAKLDG